MENKVAVNITDDNRDIIRELMVIYEIKSYYDITDFAQTLTISYEYADNTLTYAGWQFTGYHYEFEYIPYMYLFTQEFKDRFNIK